MSLWHPLFCTRIGVQLTSHTQLSYQLLGQLIDELLAMLQLTGCIFGIAIRRLAPLSTDEDLGTGVLPCGKRGHGGLRLGLWPSMLCSASLSGVGVA